MGKERRKFDTGFKQQIIQEVETGVLSVSAASRKYQISGSVIVCGPDRVIPIFVLPPDSAETEYPAPVAAPLVC
ncbi:MAG: transposase [Candidatus Binatia bacterium]